MFVSSPGARIGSIGYATVYDGANHEAVVSGDMVIEQSAYR